MTGSTDRDALRNETPAERYDRNWIEVLQELRVLQTGTQILTGFLLALAFQPAFLDLAEGQRIFYLVLVVLSALSAVIALAPVALHRILFREGAKGTIVAYGHASLQSALVIVSLLLVGVVAFIFDVVVSDTASWIAAIVLAVFVVVLWLIVPFFLRSRRNRRGES
jgi:amino acid permease